MKNYELLWECFMSEQMSVEQMIEHFKEDPQFENFVHAKIKEVRDDIKVEEI
jgi:hypothetical protein